MLKLKNAEEARFLTSSAFIFSNSPDFMGFDLTKFFYSPDYLKDTRLIKRSVKS